MCRATTTEDDGIQIKDLFDEGSSGTELKNDGEYSVQWKSLAKRRWNGRVNLTCETKIPLGKLDVSKFFFTLSEIYP